VRLQKEHVNKILSSNNISILNTDYYYIKHHYFHSQLCPIIENENENDYEKVANQYMTLLYNDKNFPITYRDNVTLNIDDQDIKEYKRRHCRTGCVDKREWFAMITELILMVITIFIALYTLIFI
jgi:hypothetical protein